MLRTLVRASALALGLAVLPLTTEAQVGGNLAAGPPVDVYLNITETADGKPVIDTNELHLITGEYYRLNITSTGETDWRLEMADLLANSHLRILTVDRGIELHLQGLAFRAIEFDEPGLLVQVSLVPVRTGSFLFTIGRNPIAQGLAAGTAGVQEPEFRTEGYFIVE